VQHDRIAIFAPASQEAAMQPGSLLPFIHDAARHVEHMLGCAGAGQLDCVRSTAARDLRALLARKPTPHSAARAAAELLCIADYLECTCGEAPREALNATRDDRAMPLENDARALDELCVPLTQDDVARALDHLKQMVERHGIDLVQSLALEMKCERLRGVMRRAGTVAHALHA
jgi:hypothetical protein